MPTLFQWAEYGFVALARYVEHDARSWDFPAEVGPVRTVLWAAGPVLDQGRLGACVGNAAVDVLNSAPLFTQGATPKTEADAVTVYSLATKLDNVPGVYKPADTGSTGLAGAKACKQLGWLPNGYSHAFGVTHLKGALQHGPVMVGTDWTDGMFTPDAEGFIAPTGPVRGGHEYEVRGYDTAGVFTIRNSWGGSWGDGGDARIREADMAGLLSAGGDVTVLRPPAA